VGNMLPHVQHPLPYQLGYTAFYWGCAVLSWPLRWTVGTFLWQLGALAISFAIDPGRVDAADRLGGAFFLVTVSVLTGAAIHARWVAHRRAFEASYALAERNAALEETMTRLQQAQAHLVAQEKLSALGRLLAGLSHEINNPMNVIKNNLDPVREHVREIVAVVARARAATAEDLAEWHEAWEEHEIDYRAGDVVDALSSMDAAVRQILQIHADLRAFIRGDAPRCVAADVVEGLRATVGLLSRSLPPTVHIDTDIHTLPAIRCQPGQLNQVWMNLLRNALDAIGNAGTVRVCARLSDDHIQVAVADSGAGVAPEFRPRLFEPFATTKGPGNGTGLGLATSYQIVESHHGRMYLDESHTPGARFVVELPVPA
jgi:signal transduction histidine kinase